MLTEEGVVLCFDWTRDLVTMPEGKSVQAIYSFDYGIIGVSPGVLYKWYGSTVREWQLEIFKTGEKSQCSGVYNQELWCKGIAA